MASQPLDVWVAGECVGTLVQEGQRFVFTYLPNVAPDRLVSLTMPVRAESYVWPQLHPVFQMNLPEGYQKDVLRARFGPVATVDDLSLLALTGRRTIGRVQVVPQGASPESPEPALDLAALLASPEAKRQFLEYLAHGPAEGVSGVHPKSLATTRDRHDEAIMITDEWVVKTGPSDLAGLALSESLCLNVARAAGLEVPETLLSADANVIAVRRFDRLPDGSPLAVEDFCALQGLAPAEKYRGSLEGLAKLVRTYVGAERLASSRERLYRLLLLNYALGNADAHLKNYALVYGSGDAVRLAPVYDVLCVTAYPEFRQDLPALTLYGKRAWASGKLLARYAAQWLSLPSKLAMDAVEETSTAVVAVAPRVAEAVDRHPWFREIGKRMLDAWEAGVSGIRPGAKAPATRGKLRESLGLSDAARLPKRRNPYGNPGGGFSRKVR